MLNPTPVDYTYLPPLWIVENGFAVSVPDGKGVMETLKKSGKTVYPTLAGAILYGDVQASAFSHPIKAEAVYDGKEALAAGTTQNLIPVGTRASYRVCATPGHLHHPPKHPTDL